MDFSLYENSTYGSKSSYPKNWSVETSSQEKYHLTKIVNFDSPKAGDYTTISLYTYDYSNIPIYTLKEPLNNVIDGYTYILILSPILKSFIHPPTIFNSL
jgi:hypothetical protein